MTAPTVQCGTYSGYQAHRSRGEAACEPCLDAKRRYVRRRYRKERARAALRTVLPPIPDPAGGRDWRARGLCGPQLHDPALWTDPDMADVEALKAAILVCGRCPVLGDCARWAAQVGEAHTVAGGRPPGHWAR